MTRIPLAVLADLPAGLPTQRPPTSDKIQLCKPSS